MRGVGVGKSLVGTVAAENSIARLGLEADSDRTNVRVINEPPDGAQSFPLALEATRLRAVCLTQAGHGSGRHAAATDNGIALRRAALVAVM